MNVLQNCTCTNIAIKYEYTRTLFLAAVKSSRDFGAHTGTKLGTYIALQSIFPKGFLEKVEFWLQAQCHL